MEAIRDKQMTLREVCESTGVSRRAIQGYEKIGLVEPTGRTPKGRLLYDELARERIKKIKLYQEFGFSVKEIKDIIDASPESLKQALLIRLEIMRKDEEHLHDLIQVANEIILSL